MKKWFLVITLVVLFSISPVLVISYAENGSGGELEPSDLDGVESTANVIGGIATAAALGFVGYETMKLRSERKQTFRAWLGIGEPKIHLDSYLNQNNEIISKSKWSELTQEQKNEFRVTRLRRYLIIKNFGQLPALKMKTRSKFIEGEKPAKEIIESEEFSSSAVLMPNSTILIFFTFSVEEERAMKDPTKSTFLVWETQYESPEEKKRKYGEIAEITAQQYSTSETWDEKSKQN